MDTQSSALQAVQSIDSALKTVFDNVLANNTRLFINFFDVMHGRSAENASPIIEHFRGELLNSVSALHLVVQLRDKAADAALKAVGGGQEADLLPAFHFVSTFEPLVYQLSNYVFSQNPGHEVLVIDAAKHYQLNYDRGDTLIFDVPGVRSVHDLATHLSAVDEQAGAVTLHFGETASIQLVGISQVADLHHGDLVFTG